MKNVFSDTKISWEKLKVCTHFQTVNTVSSLFSKNMQTYLLKTWGLKCWNNAIKQDNFKQNNTSIHCGSAYGKFLATYSQLIL